MSDTADRLRTLPPYIFTALAQRVQALAARGYQVIRLDIGSPDGAPPPAVIETLVRSASRADKHGYASYAGTPDFRKAVADYYQRRFGVTLNPASQVLPLIGSKEGLVNLCLAYLNPGDVALVPDIGYPAYVRGVLLAGAEIYWLPLRHKNHFLPDLAAVPSEIAARAKLLWVNYPNNPTGALANLDFYQQAANFCNTYNIILASDNPYFEITFDGCYAGSALQANGAVDCGIEMMSFSKTYNMGGWRLGAAVGNADILEGLLQLKSNVDTGHFLPIYDAGVAALEQTSDDWGMRRNDVYCRRRDMVINALPEIGLEAAAPQGAIYIWARVQNGNGRTYAESALEQAFVSMTPGEAFGPGGVDYVRISLCTPDDQLQLALDRLRQWCN
jgi:LL-diaminopimelate aminotransferase